MNQKDIFRRLEFVEGVSSYNQITSDTGLEVAFCGTSNSGKSSVINSLANNKKLSRVSKDPGRTQTINFFSVDKSRRIVDLPGYGYAKVSKEMKKEWGITIRKYLNSRQSLSGLIIVMDIRHSFKESDLVLIRWCFETQTPITVLLNKSDKLSKNKSKLELENAVRISKNLPGRINIQLFSAKKFIGQDELKTTICNWLKI